MAVTVYRWDDPYAPKLSASPGALINVLSACLVDGYGSKSGAGWTKTVGTNVAAYRQGALGSGMSLRVNNSVSSVGYARVVGYESMTDVDTGTNAFPTEAQIAGGLYMTLSNTTDATARPWVLAADSGRFYLWVGHNVTTTTGLATVSYEPMYFFGDIISYKPGDAFPTMLIANVTSSLSVNVMATTSLMGVTLGGHYMSRSHTSAVGAVQVGKYADTSISMSAIGNGGSAYPDPVTGSFRVGRIYVNAGTVGSTRGHLPGLWAPLGIMVGAPGDTFSGAGNTAGRSFLLLDSQNSGTRGRVALETSDTWD